MKVTTAVVDGIYPLIEKAFPKAIPYYKNNIQEFVERKSEELYTVAPYTRILFGAEDIQNFFKAMKIDKTDVTHELSKTYYWNMNFNPRAAKDEFTVAMMMVIRYFILHKDDKNAELASIYLAFSGKFYASIHSRKFEYPPQKHIMDYVINNMLTQKFDLRRTGSIFGSIRSICNTWLNTYKERFKDPDDEEIADFIQQLHGRIKSFMGNIASLYYKAHADGNYFTYDSDSDDEDSYRIADTTSLKSERSVENTLNYLSTNTVNFKMCKMASDSNVRVDEVRSIIESIQDDINNLPEIKELIRIIINEYMVDCKNKDVTSLEFITKSISAKPNTKNKNIIRQKDIIEGWLNENSTQYRKRKSRLATKSSYFKSVLTYYVLLINAANK